MRAVGFFEGTHNPFPVTDFTVHALHFVIVSCAVEPNVSYVFGARGQFTCVNFVVECFVKVWRSVGD